MARISLEPLPQPPDSAGAVEKILRFENGSPIAANFKFARILRIALQDSSITRFIIGARGLDSGTGSITLMA